MSTLKKPWVDMVEVIPILLSGIFLDIPNSLDAKRFPSAGDHFKYLIVDFHLKKSPYIRPTIHGIHKIFPANMALGGF